MVNGGHSQLVRLGGFENHRRPVAQNFCGALRDRLRDPDRIDIAREKRSGVGQNLGAFGLKLQFLFQPDPFGAEQLRESLTYLFGDGDGAWAASLRAAVLLGESAEERGRLLARLKAQAPPSDLVRRALVEAVLHGDRGRLLESLDASLLGLQPPPAGYFALRATA